MNLNEKTNFELNVLVAMHEYPELAELEGSQIVNRKGSAEFWPLWRDGAEPIIKLNYCGDWADMGPIIQREGLTVMQDGDNWLAMIELVDKHIVHRDKSPLRAAAICFLMMKGAES